MKSLPEILKANGQNPRLAYLSGELTYSEKYGCKIWTPAEALVQQPEKRKEVTSEKSNRGEGLDQIFYSPYLLPARV